MLPYRGRGRKRTLTDEERAYNRKESATAYNKTRISIGDELDRWNELKNILRLDTHPEMATYLLDCYERYSRRSAKKPKDTKVSSSTQTDFTNDLGFITIPQILPVVPYQLIEIPRIFLTDVDKDSGQSEAEMPGVENVKIENLSENGINSFINPSEHSESEKATVENEKIENTSESNINNLINTSGCRQSETEMPGVENVKIENPSDSDNSGFIYPFHCRQSETEMPGVENVKIENPSDSDNSGFIYPFHCRQSETEMPGVDNVKIENPSDSDNSGFIYPFQQSEAEQSSVENVKIENPSESDINSFIYPFQIKVENVTES